MYVTWFIKLLSDTIIFFIKTSQKNMEAAGLKEQTSWPAGRYVNHWKNASVGNALNVGCYGFLNIKCVLWSQVF